MSSRERFKCFLKRFLEWNFEGYTELCRYAPAEPTPAGYEEPWAEADHQWGATASRQRIRPSRSASRGARPPYECGQKTGTRLVC